MSKTASKTRQVVWVVSVCAACFGHAALAQQNTPDAGVILRTEPRAPDRTDRGPDIEQILRDRRAVQDVESLQIDIRAFTVKGLTVISDEEAQAVLAPYKGSGRGFQDVLDAASALRRRLADDGYFLADVVVPEQTVVNGWVELVVLEGRIGNISVEYSPGVTINKNLVQGFLSGLRTGDVARQRAVERAIFLINDLRGIVASATFKPGEKRGTADLEILVDNRPPVNGFVDYDMNGIESSGEHRYGLNADFNNLFRLGGLLNIRLNGGFDSPAALNDERFALGRVGMTVPVWSTGLRAGVGYSVVRYQLDPGTVDGQLLNGVGRVQNANLSYALIRSRNTNLTFALQYERRYFDDRLDGRVGGGGASFDNTKNISAWQVGASFDKRDLLLGGGLTFANAAYSRGELALVTPTLALQDASGLRTAGSYEKYTLGLGRFQQLNPNWIFLISATGQISSKNLDGTEQIILGGPYGIRALSPIEGRGDQGYFATAEVRRTFSEGGRYGSVVGAFFYDFGTVWRNKSPVDTTVSNMDRLSGVGVGLYWEPKGWFVRASVAIRTSGGVATLPGQTTTHFVERSPRLYLQVLKYF